MEGYLSLYILVPTMSSNILGIGINRRNTSMLEIPNLLALVEVVQYVVKLSVIMYACLVAVLLIVFVPGADQRCVKKK
jgi:hypothetical protein